MHTNYSVLGTFCKGEELNRGDTFPIHPTLNMCATSPYLVGEKEVKTTTKILNLYPTGLPCILSI